MAHVGTFSQWCRQCRSLVSQCRIEHKHSLGEPRGTGCGGGGAVSRWRAPRPRKVLGAYITRNSTWARRQETALYKNLKKRARPLEIRGLDTTRGGAGVRARGGGGPWCVHTKGYSGTCLAMGFANVRAGTWSANPIARSVLEYPFV